MDTVGFVKNIEVRMIEFNSGCVKCQVRKTYDFSLIPDVMDFGFLCYDVKSQFPNCYIQIREV